MKNFNEDALRLEGRNAVLEALKSERDIDKILVQEGSKEGSIKNPCRSQGKKNCHPYGFKSKIR